MTNYSFKAPSKGKWRIEKTDGLVETVVLTKETDEATSVPAPVQLKVIRNLITTEQLVQMSGKENADNIRNIEKHIMLEEGVKRGLYRLHDVTMGEEMVAGKQFYFMDYRTETTTDWQPSSFYLFFPRERNNEWFIMVHYSEVWPKGRKSNEYSKADLREVLRSLDLGSSERK